MSKRKERRREREGIKARQAEEREATRKANEIAEEEQRVAKAARIVAEIKITKEQEPPKQHRVATRRKLGTEEDPDHCNGEQNENGKQCQRGDLFSLLAITKGPSTRTSAPKDPHDRNYTVITRHLFDLNGIEEFKTMFFIPENAEVVEVPENMDTPAHYSVRMGDAFVYISTDFGEVKPGMTIEGWAELKVKAVKKPNIGPRSGFYPYVNIWRPLENDQDSEYILELDSEKWFVESGNFAFTPASGKSETILRMSRINNVI